jgi:hypothetical protein
VALAPADFGKFSGALLIGNFGDGRINAYDLATHDFRGPLATAAMTPISIGGLWGIAFGNGVAGQPVNVLFFAAGPDDEEHGLYGRIEAVPAQPRTSRSGHLIDERITIAVEERSREQHLPRARSPISEYRVSAMRRSPTGNDGARHHSRVRVCIVQLCFP